MKYSALYQVSPATFHVISRKVDFLWDRLRRPQLKKHYTEAAAYTAWRFLGSHVSHKRFFISDIAQLFSFYDMKEITFFLIIRRRLTI